MLFQAQYFRLLQKYQAIHGPKVALLFQLGCYYQLLGYDPKKCLSKNSKYFRGPSAHLLGYDPGYYEDRSICYDTPMGQEQLEHISALLNLDIHMERKDRPYSMNNCDLAGFPQPEYTKRKEQLLAAGYTVVKVDQINTENTSQYKEEDLLRIHPRGQARMVTQIIFSTIHTNIAVEPTAADFFYNIALAVMQEKRVMGSSFIHDKPGTIRCITPPSGPDDDLFKFKEFIMDLNVLFDRRHTLGYDISYGTGPDGETIILASFPESCVSKIIYDFYFVKK